MHKTNDDVSAAEQVDTTNPLTGIALKIISVAIFVGMASSIKASGQLPAGQIVFFRSFFAIFPILAFLAFRGALRSCAYDKPAPQSYRAGRCRGVVHGAGLLRAHPAAVARSDHA